MRTRTWSLCACTDTCCCSSAPHRWCRCSEKGSHRHSRSGGGEARKAGPLRTGSSAQVALTGSANESAEWGGQAHRRAEKGQNEQRPTSSSSRAVKFFLNLCLKWSPLVFLFFFSATSKHTFRKEKTQPDRKPRRTLSRKQEVSWLLPGSSVSLKAGRRAVGPGGGREDKGSSWRHKGSTHHPAEPPPSHTPGSCLFPGLPAVCSTFSDEWLHPRRDADQPPPELGRDHRGQGLASWWSLHHNPRHMIIPGRAHSTGTSCFEC